MNHFYLYAKLSLKNNFHLESLETLFQKKKKKNHDRVNNPNKNKID